jgi:hypothetical protein
MHSSQRRRLEQEMDEVRSPEMENAPVNNATIFKRCSLNGDRLQVRRAVERTPDHQKHLTISDRYIILTVAGPSPSLVAEVGPAPQPRRKSGLFIMGE